MDLTQDGLVDELNKVLRELTPDQLQLVKNLARVSISMDGTEYILAIQGRERLKGRLEPPIKPEQFYSSLDSGRLEDGYVRGLYREDFRGMEKRFAHIWVDHQLVGPRDSTPA